MERVEYFRNYLKYAKEIKRVVSKYLDRFEMYVFGSVVRGGFSPGLSDIDVAVVSEEFESREKMLEVYDELFERFFETPFEFHLLTPKRWEFYRRFIGDGLLKV